jgi:hypothetical protein
MIFPESLFLKPGWCTKEKTERLYNLVKDTKPELTVEFGVFGGRSLIPMALAHKNNNKGKIIGIDPWEKEASIASYDTEDPNYKWWFALDHNAILKSFVTSLHEYKLNDIVEYHRKKSNEVINMFDDMTIDILHQDGNHTEHISSEEVELFNKKIKPGGFWLMDDCDWPTTRNAQELILTKGFSLYEDHIAWKIFKKDS